MPHLETRQNGVGSEGSPAVFGTTSDDATPTVGAVEEILVKSSVARPSGVLDALQQQYPRRSWKLLKRKESWQSAAVAVVSAEGTRIAENAEEWLKREAPPTALGTCWQTQLPKTVQLFQEKNDRPLTRLALTHKIRSTSCK